MIKKNEKYYWKVWIHIAIAPKSICRKCLKLWCCTQLLDRDRNLNNAMILNNSKYSLVAHHVRVLFKKWRKLATPQNGLPYRDRQIVLEI